MTFAYGYYLAQEKHASTRTRGRLFACKTAQIEMLIGFGPWTFNLEVLVECLLYPMSQYFSSVGLVIVPE